MSDPTLPWDKMIRRSQKREKTCLIYYGGKSRDAAWILDQFPPHETFVDVFGGGAAVILAKRPSDVDVYNDIGNVSNFFRQLRDSGDELYRLLYFTPWSRQEYEECYDTWETAMSQGNLLEWARRWYVVINQGYSHEEKGSKSWHIAKQVDSAGAGKNHVDNLPWIIDRFRSIHIEHADFEYIIKTYDLPRTLFYIDPPYVSETRYETGNYLHEMPIMRHVDLLGLLTSIKGQAVVSNYDNELYNNVLGGWRRVERTHPSAIQNSRSVQNRGSRTEVLWVKEHDHGLWSAPAHVAGIPVFSRLPETDGTGRR